MVWRLDWCCSSQAHLDNPTHRHNSIRATSSRRGRSSTAHIAGKLMKEIVTKSKRVAPPWAKASARIIHKRSDFLPASVKEAADHLWAEIKVAQMARRSE